MNELKDQLDSAVESQNFLLAQEVKAEIDAVESEQLATEELIQQLKGTETLQVCRHWTFVEHVEQLSCPGDCP